MTMSDFFFAINLQTNLQFNNNKYYLIQLLQDDSAKVYSVWLRWGRGMTNWDFMFQKNDIWSLVLILIYVVCVFSG